MIQGQSTVLADVMCNLADDYEFYDVNSSAVLIRVGVLSIWVLSEAEVYA